MKHRIVKSIATAGLLAAGSLAGSPVASASLILQSQVGGAPTGVNYVNFDNLPTGSAGGTSGGIAVSFVPDGQAVTGAVSGEYAAPFLSNGNGIPFGNPDDGPDETIYLTTGLGKVVLSLPGSQKYFGLLWGSVDSYNTLSFYSGGALGTLVGSITGTDVTASANGDQGVNGTFYVNITSNVAFDTVVASSSSYAFEFDNVAYNATLPTPEPSTLVTGGLAALAGLGLAWRRRRIAPAA